MSIFNSCCYYRRYADFTTDGSIMGAGLGVAVYDFRSGQAFIDKLGRATFISLVVSALYFSLTPLRKLNRSCSHVRSLPLSGM